MEPTLLRVLLFAAGLVVGALIVAGIWFWRDRKSSSGSRHLKKCFGPEYERAVKRHDSRERAELELLDRERRAERLPIRPLSSAEAQGFRSRWTAIQRHFVDEPEAAMDEAHALLEELMREIGYPTDSYREEVELVSVHHPNSIHHYRAAHALAEERERGQTSTEEQRQALLHYRALFDDLLFTDDFRYRGESDGASRDQRATR